MLSAQAKRYFARTAPRASQILSPTTGLAGVPGSVLVLPVTVAANYLNLSTTFGQQPTQIGQNNASGAWASQISGLCSSPQAGIRLCLQAIGATVGIITGTLVGDVTAGNAPALGTQGTLLNGAYGPAAGSCWEIAPNAIIEFEALFGIDNFLGFVGNGNGSLNLFQCSAAGA